MTKTDENKKIQKLEYRIVIIEGIIDELKKYLYLNKSTYPNDHVSTACFLQFIKDKEYKAKKIIEKYEKENNF